MFNLLRKKTTIKAVDKVMRRYGSQKTAVGRCVKKQVKSLANRFVGTAIFVIRTYLTKCLRLNPKLVYGSKHLHRDWRKRSWRTFGGGTDIGGGEPAGSVHLFLLVEDGIYKQSLTPYNTLLVELADIYFKSAYWDASFE